MIAAVTIFKNTQDRRLKLNRKVSEIHHHKLSLLFEVYNPLPGVILTPPPLLTKSRSDLLILATRSDDPK